MKAKDYLMVLGVLIAIVLGGLSLIKTKVLRAEVLSNTPSINKFIPDLSSPEKADHQQKALSSGQIIQISFHRREFFHLLLLWANHAEQIGYAARENLRLLCLLRLSEF